MTTSGTLPARCTRPDCRGEACDRPAPPPHHAARVCTRCGAWLGWVPAPMTIERASAVVVPFGKHRGKTMGEVCDTDPSYLRWGIESGAFDGSLGRAAEFLENYIDEDDTPRYDRIDKP